MGSATFMTTCNTKVFALCVWAFLFAGLQVAATSKPAFSYISPDDITSHPTYAASLDFFLQIEKDMHRIEERASFHSFVHLIPPVLELIHAVNVLEIGSYCGASLILELSVPTVKQLVSVDMLPHRHVNTHAVISQNVKKYNTHGATFHQVIGDSRSEQAIARVYDIYPPRSVDFFFIDGDHRNCAPDFYLYQSLVRLGGIIMFDDYYDHRVAFAITRLLKNSTNRNCYHVLGTPLNVANASTLPTEKNMSPKLSNEFIMQKKFDCNM